MASSTGSFPVYRPRHFKFALTILAALGIGLAARAEVPGYVREALAHFSTEVPAGWAYTLTTVRNNEAQVSARFDPSKVPDQQWTLLQVNGKAPTEKEIAQYARIRAAGNSPAPQATFHKADISPESIELIREDSTQGEFRARFREEATGSDKMLGHLKLRLIVNKQLPAIEKYILELDTPYSPILGVKMKELVVQASFRTSGPGQPAVPVESSSHFLGSIFLIGTEENLQLTYSDCVQVR